MILKPMLYILIGFGLLLITLLFVGLKHDPEFYSDVEFFIKYKPTFQFVFVDPSFGDQSLTPELQRQADRYANFVYGHKIFDFSPLLIQAALSFLAIGFSMLRQIHTAPLRLFLFHFLLCIFPTIIGVVLFITYYGQAFQMSAVLLLAALLNVFIAYKLVINYKNRVKTLLQEQD